MVRRTIAVAALVLAVGCTGSIDEGEQVSGLTPAQQLAQTAWLKKALPALKAGTCNTCHDGSMEPTAPGYMAGEKDLDVRDTMVAFIPAVVNLNSPQVSRVVVKGMHEGPALSAQEASDIATWISYERSARAPAMAIETAQMTPMMCTAQPCPLNTFDLSALGSTGSKIDFEVTQLGSDLYITALNITAGPSGLHLVHPTFETWPAGMMDPTPDPADPFFSVSLNLAAGAQQKLGTNGSVTLAGFLGSNPLSVRFDELSVKM